MKTFFGILILSALFFISCSVGGNLKSIVPKSGKLEIPSKGELRVWQNTEHSNFVVELQNDNTNQSCEVYYVKSDGNEKWVRPSLLASTTLKVKIPKDGHLFIKNFNPNVLIIKYTVHD